MQEEEVLQDKKNKLAVAIARGESITVRARGNEVNRRTAFRWAKEPGVRRAIERLEIPRNKPIPG